MIKHKLFAGAALPLILAATACMVAGCKNDKTKDVAASTGDTGASTKVAVLPSDSKSSSQGAPATGAIAPTSKTSTATSTTALNVAPVGAPVSHGQLPSTTTPGARPGPGVAPTGSAASAQSHGDEYLKLTPEQEARNKAIVDDANHQMTILRSQQTLSPQEKMKRYQALNESVHRNMIAVLTPEQRSRLAAKQNEQMQLASGRFVATLDQGVHLSPEQKVKMLSLVGGTMKQEQALGNNDALSLAQKQASMRTIQQSMSAQMKALLTPQQLKTVEALNAQAMAARARAGKGQQPPAAPSPE